MEKYRHSSRCPKCGKLLTKPMVQVETVDLTPEQIEEYKKGFRIAYGAQTKCRHRDCKKLRETLKVIDLKDLVGREAQ